MKPIEAGCMALYVGGKTSKGDVLSACEVTVKHLEPNPDRYENCFGCGGPARTHAWVCEGLPNGYRTTCSCTLLRIDGEPETENRKSRHEPA